MAPRTNRLALGIGLCILALAGAVFDDAVGPGTPVLAALAGLGGIGCLVRARTLATRGAARPEYESDAPLSESPVANLAQRELASFEFVVFDTETTGLRPHGGDEIIAIGAVKVTDRHVRTEAGFDALAHPGRAIPPASTKIHGITDAMVGDRLPVREVLADFHRFAGDGVLVAHNAAFDLAFLTRLEKAAGVHFSNPVLDTLNLSRHLHPGETDHSLDAVAERYGIALEARHSAWGDALATAEVFVRQLAELESRGTLTLGEALRACGTGTALRRARAGVGAGY
jgi:DNA polymerase-3 subunit epsilon